MAFREKIKLQVKRKAGFQCCRCHDIGVEVHHIIPQKDGGSDDIENAASLCPSCHEKFGDNPHKRKEIKEMRDWWYEVIEEKYGDRDNRKKSLERLEEISGSLETVKQGLSDTSELKDLLRLYIDEKLDNLTPETAITSASDIITGTTVSNMVHQNYKCPGCGTSFGLLVGTNECPECHRPIN